MVRAPELGLGPALMRWKLLRRRLSVSAPRVIVRSHLPWPLRWLVLAMMLGFSAALALWAFEFGKDIAGLDRVNKQQVQALRGELAQLREQYSSTRAIANSAETVLKAERAAQERLAEQVKSLEQRNAELAGDLGFFEKLLPASGADQAVSVRGLQASLEAVGQLHYQLLVMSRAGSRSMPPKARYELVLTGTLAGKPWTQPAPGGARPLEGHPYQRLEGLLSFPAAAQVRQLTARVIDANGAVLVSETTRL
jgi:hypothetical protein